MEVSWPVKSWGDAVRAVLRRGNSPLPESHVASRVGVSRAMLHQYLSGVRRPKPELVQRINAAVGDLLHAPSAAAHLEAEARFNELINVDWNVLIRDGIASLSIAIDRLSPE